MSKPKKAFQPHPNPKNSFILPKQTQNDLPKANDLKSTKYSQGANLASKKSQINL